MSGQVTLKPSPNSSQASTEPNKTDTYRPTVESILGVLDFEINRITVEQQRPGWTLWAIYGGLVSSGWLLLDQWEKGSVNVINVLHLFLIFSLITDIITDSQILLPNDTKRLKKTPRVKQYTEITRPLDAFLFMARSGLLLLIAILLRNKINLIQTGITLFYYGVLTVLGVLGFVISLFNISILFPPQPWEIKARMVSNIISVIVLAALVWAVSGYIELALAHPILISVSDFRVAGLLYVISFLIPMLAEHSKDNPLLTSLIEIRRDLAFGHVDLQTAVQQSDIAIAGLKAEEALRVGFSDLLQFMEELDQEVRKLAGNIEQIKAELPKSGESVTQEHEDKAKQAAKTIGEQMRKLADKGFQMSRKIKKIRRRAALFGDVSPESKKAGKEVIAKIEEARDKLLLRTVEMAQSAFSIIGQVRRDDSDISEAILKMDVSISKLKEVITTKYQNAQQ